MKISLTFDSLPEVDQFAQDWLGKRGKAPAPAPSASASVPVATTTPAVVTAAPVPPVTAGPAVQTPMPAPAPAPAPAAPTPPAPAPQVTIEDVTRAAVALADQGRKADLLALLGKFGVRAITELGAEQLGPFKQALEILGGGA
ncbi:MAG: hypothetical protein IKQ10_07910 [Oscillospiraceae bacterium]|nr:hypothetical protein [Oscillospiraceae bacterium]